MRLTGLLQYSASQAAIEREYKSQVISNGS